MGNRRTIAGSDWPGDPPGTDRCAPTQNRDIGPLFSLNYAPKYSYSPIHSGEFRVLAPLTEIYAQEKNKPQSDPAPLNDTLKRSILFGSVSGGVTAWHMVIGC